MEPLTDDQHTQEGIAVDNSPLALDIDDALLNSIIDKALADDEKFYEQELNLKKRTKENLDFWLGNQLDLSKLPSHLEPYKDNIIWQDSEKRIEIASGRMPDIIATPASDDLVKRERAKLLEKQLQIVFSSGKIKRLIKDGLRLHGINFIAAIKPRWDPNKGEGGDYVFELVRPGKFGLDHTGTISHDGFTIDNIDIVWEIIEEPLAVVLAKFPKKANELKALFKGGISNKDLVSKIKYREIHFTWYTGDGQPIECVLHRYQKIILDKMKTPYFDYEGYTKRVWEDVADPNVPDKQVKSKLGKYYRNYFDRPRKNYILFSYQNLGRSPYDDTTPIEQTIPLQRNINKRGRQITDIADKMKPRFAFNNAIQKKDAEAVSNDSEDHIWLNTSEPITSAVTSFQSLGPSPILYNDLVSNRGQIDAKFSTQGTTRGEVKASSESGISKQITREGDLVTSDDIVDVVVERVVFEMASWAVQFMKLFYDKPHYVRDIGPDGEVLQAELTRDLIDDGVAINVRASSVDKVTRRNDAFNLAKVKGIDPLTLAEDMEVPNPKERTRRLMYFMMGNQDQYARYMRETGLLDEGKDQQGQPQPEQPGSPAEPQAPQMMGADQAQQDAQALMSGQPVQPQMPPGPEYIQALMQILSPQFDNLPPEAQDNIRNYIAQLKQMVAGQMEQAGAQDATQQQG